MITEAQDNLRNFWILLKLSEILISLTGNQNNVCAVFANVFHIPFNLEHFFTNVTDVTSYKWFFMCQRHLKHINVIFVEIFLEKA